MKNSHNIDLISNKIILFNDFAIEFIENNVKKLTPAGKYQVYLLTSAIVFNRLRAIDAFNTNKINTDDLTTTVLDNAINKFQEYKLIHDKVYNTFKHSSAIIQGSINRENRSFFNNSLDLLRKKSILTIMEFNNELNNKSRLDIIYLNLFVFPFINTNLEYEELNSVKRSYLNIIDRLDYFELNNFNQKITELINIMSNKLNEDSYFISNMSGKGVGSKNCYIATLVYNDIEHPKVEFLRNYRDNVLSNYLIGRLFIKYYYMYSPRLVKLLKKIHYPQIVIKFILDCFIRIKTK